MFMDTIYYNSQDDEFWKDINDYEGLYMVSNLGRVKSLNYNHTGKERIIKQYDNGNGYLQAKLHKYGNVKRPYVHRLVWQAFNAKIPVDKEIDHKDGNPKNNKLSNLSCVTHKGNMENPVAIKRLSEAMKKPVDQFTLDGQFVKTWASATDAARELGLDQSGISKCCNEKRKTTGGFKWQYAEWRNGISPGS